MPGRFGMGASLLAAFALQTAVVSVVQAGEQADRAVAAVRQLIAKGEIKPGTPLRLRAKQGNMVSILGRDYQLQKEWERQTGILIDASVMPQLDSLEFIRGSSDIDLTIARNHEYADLFQSGLIEDLGPFFQRFGFALPDAPASDYLLPRLLSEDVRVAVAHGEGEEPA